MIIDQVKIYCEAGSGGSGFACTLKGLARKGRGGGGDGGSGGSIIIKVSDHPYDLSAFGGHKRFVAAVGANGGPNNKKGKDAPDLIVPVPAGTIIRDLEGHIIFDLTGPAKEFLLCQGGRGGEGNYKRDYTIPPKPGQAREVVLDYRIPAEAALIGFANSGKTALFNRLTGKEFKVAAYPFTTHSCVLANGEYDFRRFSLMDTPPLKKSAKELDKANSFLKHLYRVRLILLLSDSQVDYQQEFSALKREIALFDESFLDQKKLFYLLTKVDKIDKTPQGEKIVPLSVEAERGLDRLQQAIVRALA